jgi:hypothetical protein
VEIVDVVSAAITVCTVDAAGAVGAVSAVITACTVDPVGAVGAVHTGCTVDTAGGGGVSFGGVRRLVSSKLTLQCQRIGTPDTMVSVYWNPLKTQKWYLSS